LPIPFYYQSRSNENVHRNLWLIIDWNKESDELTNLWFIPIFGYGKNSYLHFVPLYFSTENKKEKTYFGPIYYFNSTKNENSNLIFFTYWSSEKYEEGKENNFHIIPLFFYHNHLFSLSKKRSEKRYIVSPLLYYSHNKSDINKNHEMDSTLLIPIIPIIYFSSISYDDSSHRNLLLVFDWEKDMVNKLNRIWFIPILFWGNGESNYFNLFPLFFSWGNESSKYYIIAGLYLHSQKTYSRQNFLYIYDHSYDSTKLKRNLNLLFSSIHYSNSPGEFSFGLLYRLAGGVTYKKANQYNYNILNYYNSKSKNSSYNIFFPIWWYEKTHQKSYFVSLPILVYTKYSPKTEFELFGLGLFWYNNTDLHQNEHTKLVLLGLVFEKIKSSSRGFQSYGSFWGALWDYQIESKTDYRHFSILGFVYSYTVIKGETRHRIFGIKL